LYIEILRVPCRHNVGIRSRRTVGSIRSKQPERQNGRKQKCLKEAGVFCLKENLMDKSRKQNYNTLKIFFASKIEKKGEQYEGTKNKSKATSTITGSMHGGMQSTGNNSIRSRRKAEVGGYRIYP
jgi:hypothetical protein